MKNLKHLFTALLLLCATVATAHDFEVGGIYYNITSTTDFTVEVTYRGSSYYEYSNEYSGNVVIPESVTYYGFTYRVTSIGSSAFRDCSGLTSVVIPNSVTSIGNYVFSGCSGLTSVEIGNSVTSIGNGAFYECSGLASVVIPNSVTSIGSSAFYGTAWYNNQPDGVVYAGKVLYKYKGTMSSNTSIAIKDGTLGIGGSAFDGCSGLTSVVIPNSVTSIGERAFYDCSGLTNVEIPNSVTSIGRDAFARTAWYNNQPDGVVYAGKVFYKYKGTMSSNTSIAIKDGTLGIGGSAFYNCTGLANVVIPNSVTSIGDLAFSECSGLTSVVIPNSVTSIGSSAFYNCNGLKEVHISDLSAWCGIEFGNDYANPLYYAHNLYLNGELVTDLVIPDGVTSIGGYAFYGCSGLTSVVIPNSVTRIGWYAFERCTGLTNVVIPNSVTSIGYCAFYGCSSLTNVVIPNSVTSIGDYAFSDCTGLTSVVIPNSVTSIGYCAFYGCSSLTNVVIPNSVTSIGDYAFHSCSGLKSVEIPNSVTSIGRYAFSYCSGLTSVEILDGVTGIGEYAFYGCSDLEYIYISSTIESIGDYAFAECNNIFDIKIGSKKAVAASENVFSSDAYNNACLYVPAGRKDFYAKTSPWSNFIIQETDFTGIDEVKGENGKVKGVYYDLNGRAVERPANGLYIKNGKKVFVK